MILFLHGADTYRSRQKLKELKEKFRREVDPQGYNLTQLEGKTLTSSQIFETANAHPFMASKRMLVIEQLSEAAFSEEEEAALSELFTRLLDEELILVAWEAELAKKDLASGLCKILSSSKYVLTFPALNAQAVAGWIQAKLQEQGTGIRADALQYLSLAVEDDLWRAASEADKLGAYAQANGVKQFDLPTIELLVAGGVQDNIFALVDAVSSKRLREALLRLREQKRSGMHELEILSMVFRQYRLLQQVKSGQQEGMSADGIASAYKMHPFVAKKMLAQSAHFDEAAILASYRTLVRTDLQMKSTGLPAEILMTSAVAKLAS